MKYLTIFLFILLFSCNKEFKGITNDPISVFEEAWKYVDENYVYFEYKNINWDSIKFQHLPDISENISEEELFTICSDIIYELNDGHCYLHNGKFSVSYNFTQGYDIYFDLELIKRNYLSGNFIKSGAYTYGIIQDTIGYLYYQSFKEKDYFAKVIQYFSNSHIKKLIIDIRNNGGGGVVIPQNMVEYLIDKESLVGYIQHKNGREHNSFSDKISIIAIPKHNNLNIPVNVLINRESYSASSFFAGMVKHLPNFKLIGQITGGGGGGPRAFELPNGWVVAVTSNFFVDSQNHHIENGVEPDFYIENTQIDIENGTDKMLEYAIEN